MATSATLAVAPYFPSGTSVGAYPKSGWPFPQQDAPSGAPVPSPTTTATVGSTGSLAFSGLATQTDYYAAASVGGTWKYVRFSTREAVGTSGYGTLAARPSAGATADRSLYFATDDNGGTTYQVQSGAWVKVTPGVLETGGRELAQVENTATGLTLTTSLQDVPSLSIAVTAGSRPFYVEASLLGQIALGTGVSGSDSQMEVLIVDTSDSSVKASAFWRARLPTSTNVQQMMQPCGRVSLASGTTKTYKVQARAIILPANSTSSIGVGAGGSGQFPKATLRAIEA